jgi:hypothetical protein
MAISALWEQIYETDEKKVRLIKGQPSIQIAQPGWKWLLISPSYRIEVIKPGVVYVRTRKRSIRDPEDPEYYNKFMPGLKPGPEADI